MEYKDLVQSYATNPRNVHTVPKTNAPQRWFFVSVSNAAVYVQSGTTAFVNCKIQGLRRLVPSEVEIMLSIYQRRKDNQPVSVEATKATRNQVYWYGIFSDLNL